MNDAPEHCPKPERSVFPRIGKVVNGGNQKLGIDIFLRLIRDRHIIGAKDAEQIEFFVALREKANLLASGLPRSRQTGLHREPGFVAEI